MFEIRPAILIGIGPQAEQTVSRYVERIQIRHGQVPALLPVAIRFQGSAFSFRREIEGVQHLALETPAFDSPQEWPAWLPPELADMPPAERARTRAWMRAAMLQQADEFQEFLLESIPHLSSFAAIEEMNNMDIAFAGDSEIRVYIIADLSDHLANAVLVDVAYMTMHVCHQLGYRPRTTGVCYLPRATSPAPAEEALAYAGLKELEHYLERQAYDGDPVPEWAIQVERAPFEDGCYLVDNVNELGYTLEDPRQQVTAAAEWLYAMTMLNLQAAVRQQRERRYLSATLRHKSRAYESFGMAVRYVPHVPLMDWATARLNAQIIAHLSAPAEKDDSDLRAEKLIAYAGIDLASLPEQLRHHARNPDMAATLAPLRQAGLNQVDQRARQVLQQMRSRHLPAFDQALTAAIETARSAAEKAIEDEIERTLDADSLRGVAIARRVLQALQAQVADLQHQVDDLANRHRTELRQSLASISQANYTLRAVSMSIPPWPVIALALFSLLLLPLLYGVTFVWQVVRAISQIWGLVSLGVLGLGTAGVLGYIAHRFRQQVQMVADQHTDLIRQRYELESRPLVTRSLRTLYDATAQLVQAREKRLAQMQETMQRTAQEMEQRAAQSERRLRELAAPGPFRSVIGVEQAERFLSHLPGTEQIAGCLVQEIGSVVEWWQGSAGESWFSDRLTAAGSQYLEQHLRELGVLDVLTRDADPAQLRRDLQHMLSTARPLWNYGERALSRAKTERMTLVGLDTGSTAWDRVVEPLSALEPALSAIDTGDPFTMAVLSIHRGLPLFALRRIDEYRTHYAEMLRHSRLPVHTTQSLTLTEDVIPIWRRTKLSTVTLFAAGLALECIHRDPDGRYLAPRAHGKTLRLSADKARAVALLSLDAPARRELQRQLDRQVKERGRTALHAFIDEYLTATPDLEDWQVTTILNFSRTYHLDQGSGAGAAP